MTGTILQTLDQDERDQIGEFLFHKARQGMADDFDKPSITTYIISVFASKYSIVVKNFRRGQFYHEMSERIFNVLMPTYMDPTGNADPIEREALSRLYCQATTNLQVSTPRKGFWPVTLPLPNMTVFPERLGNDTDNEAHCHFFMHMLFPHMLISINAFNIHADAAKGSFDNTVPFEAVMRLEQDLIRFYDTLAPSLRIPFDQIPMLSLQAEALDPSILLTGDAATLDWL